MTRLKKGDRKLSCGGDLQSKEAVENLQAELLARIQAGVNDLTLDLAELKAVSAFGVQVLLGAANTLRAMEQSLYLENVDESVLTFFRRLNISGQFVIQSDSQPGGQS
jgi:anti-anti-sigma factor